MRILGNRALTVVAVCSPYRPDERAHFTASVATTTVQMGVGTLLIDLDSERRSTSQLFSDPDSRRVRESALARGQIGRGDLLTLRLNLFRGGFFVRSALLYCLPAADDLEQLERREPEKIDELLKGLLQTIPKKLDLVLLDAPQLPSNLSTAALNGADLVVFPIRAGEAFDSEIKSCASFAREAGLEPGKLAYVLTATDSVGQSAGDLSETARKLREEPESAGIGHLFASGIGPDLDIIGQYRVEEQTRDDWIEVTAELIATIGAMNAAKAAAQAK